MTLAAVGALTATMLAIGSGPAAARDADPSGAGPANVAPARVGAGAERAKAPAAGVRSRLSTTYPYVPPPPPPPPAPDVPAICLQRPHIICASKSEKTLRYFESGALWLSTPVAFGRPGYETPAGLWSVKIKDPNAWSYPYSAWMPYSLEYDLVRGIYIHYSSTYGSIGPGYIGSHGCINIGSLETARTLFNRVPLGAAVYVY